MKREEAEFILAAYRPNGEDAASPDFSVALQMTENDPELRKWFAAEQRMDGFVSDALRYVSPPADLRERILAGARLSREHSVVIRPRWWRRSKILALAAVLLGFALLSSRFLLPVGGDNLPEFALNYASRGFLLQSRGHDLTQLRDWLAAKNMPTPATVPERLAGLAKLGCRTVHFRGKEVSILCFEGDREYHLFVVRKTDFPNLAAGSVRQIQTQGKWSSAAWSDAENSYVLVSKADSQALERLL